MPNSPILNKEIISELKIKLLEEKTQLEKELATVAEKHKGGAGNEWQAKYENIGGDWDENAYEVTDFATRVSLESTLEESLNAVKGAINRIESDNYGFCEAGKEPISPERLKVNPEATTCLEHAN